MSLLEEYRVSLKMPEVEEVLDLVFYRPLAYVFVKAVYRTKITPNQVTLLSMVAGLIAAFNYMRGDPTAFVWGGTWFAVANIFDCADGQLARLQKSGTPLGRLVDGVIDYVVSVAVFVGLGIGLTALTGNSNVWILVVVAGISSAVQSITYDFIVQEYLSIVRGEKHYILRELEKLDAELKRLHTERARTLRLVGLRIYFRYLSLQRHVLFGSQSPAQVSPDTFRQKNQRAMRSWTMLGSTMNRSVLILASVLGKPELFCWCVVVLGNMYLVYMFMWRRQIRRDLAPQVAH